MLAPSTLQEREWLFASAAAAVALSAYFLFSAKRSSKTHAIPGGRVIHSLPNPHPILGDMPTFIKNSHRFHEWVTEMSLRFNGEPWRIRLPLRQNRVIITQPDLIEEVTIYQFSNFPRGAYQNELKADLLGWSIVTFDGDKWYRQRKAATRFFTAKALRRCMTQTMRVNMEQVCGIVDDGAATATPVDMKKLFLDFALQTFLNVGLGLDAKIIGSSEQHPLDEAMEIGTPILTRRLKLPSFYWKFERWAGYGPEKRLAEAMAEIRTWLKDVLSQSMQLATQRGASKVTSDADDTKTVVELFMEQSHEDQDGLRAEDLPDFIRLFVLAARNTSAVALGYVFLMLAKHQDVQQRLYTELATAREAAALPADAYLTTEHVNHLVYLEAIIKETVRLYPSFPSMTKESAEATTLSNDKLGIGKGELVISHFYAMARQPSVWGPDAAEFKPERWIDSATGELITVTNTKFASFGSGPRICIGMKLAMLELRLVTANLVSQYAFALAEPNDGGHLMAVELMMKDPLMMHATKRQVKA